MRVLSPHLARVAASIDLFDARGETQVLPRPGAVLGLQLRGRVESDGGLLALAGVTGMQSAARRYRYQGETRSLLVRFTPEGAAALGVPANELAGKSLPLDALIDPPRARRLIEQVREARDDAAAVAHVEAFLLSLKLPEDPAIDRARALLARPGGARVSAIAEQLGISERQLERRFLARIGVGPKRFAALSRFERALELAARGLPLTEVALEAGYFDQPHFIREFRKAAGSAPRAFFNGRSGERR